MDTTIAPTELIFYPMSEGQGWYIVGVYPAGEIDATKTIRVTLAQLSSFVSLPLAHQWTQSLAEHFGLPGFKEVD